jgi:hypothetical protein
MGSIIVDELDLIGSPLTGSTSKTKTPDATYITPMWWLCPRIKQHFPNASLYPTTIALVLLVGAPTTSSPMFTLRSWIAPSVRLSLPNRKGRD